MFQCFDIKLVAVLDQKELTRTFVGERLSVFTFSVCELNIYVGVATNTSYTATHISTILFVRLFRFKIFS